MSVDELGKRLRELRENTQPEERAKQWWRWYGDSLVRRLQTPVGMGFITELGFASGGLKYTDSVFELSEEYLKFLMDHVCTDPLAYDLAFDICSIHLSQCKPLPDELQRFMGYHNIKAIKRPSKTGSPHKRERKLFVIQAIEAACLYGFKPTRAVGSKRICGCSLVVKAFKKAGKGKDLNYSKAWYAWRTKGDFKKEILALSNAAQYGILPDFKR